jgi:hypothetical protein
MRGMIRLMRVWKGKGVEIGRDMNYEWWFGTVVIIHWIRSLYVQDLRIRCFMKG